MWPALFQNLPNAKTNGRLSFFEDWRTSRSPKVATLEPGGLFKYYDLAEQIKSSPWKFR